MSRPFFDGVNQICGQVKKSTITSPSETSIVCESFLSKKRFVLKNANFAWHEGAVITAKAMGFDERFHPGTPIIVLGTLMRATEMYEVTIPYLKHRWANYVRETMNGEVFFNAIYSNRSTKSVVGVNILNACVIFFGDDF